VENDKDYEVNDDHDDDDDEEEEEEEENRPSRKAPVPRKMPRVLQQEMEEEGEEEEEETMTKAERMKAFAKKKGSEYVKLLYKCTSELYRDDDVKVFPGHSHPVASVIPWKTKVEQSHALRGVFANQTPAWKANWWAEHMEIIIW
jgi:hypothetical protein